MPASTSAGYNNAPVFAEETDTRAIDENTAQARASAFPVATDPDMATP